MKKTIAVILAVLMLGLFGSASAQTIQLLETAGAFDIKMEVPDDAKVDQQVMQDDMSLIEITFSDAAKPTINLIIAPDEEYAGMSMKDLSDDELKQIFETAAAQLEKPSYTTAVTTNGIKYMVINEDAEDNSDVADLMTIQEGYDIQFFMVHEGDYATITDEDLSLVTAMMDSLLIVQVKE